jgi:hypothetical protein
MCDIVLQCLVRLHLIAKPKGVNRAGCSRVKSKLGIKGSCRLEHKSLVPAFPAVSKIPCGILGTGERRLGWTDDLIGDEIPPYAILSHT